MHVTLLYFDDCPNWREAESRISQVVDELGLPPSTLTLQRIDTSKAAQDLPFCGSPTILVNGVDPFAQPSAPAEFVCRVYWTPDGPDGAPSRSQLAEAISGGRTAQRPAAM